MNQLADWLMFLATALILPAVTVGTIRKVKAALQNRQGPPVLQPIFDLIKLLSKREVVSTTASFVFRFTAAINLSIMIAIAVTAPWLSFKPLTPADDLFLMLYLLALTRFMSIIASLDTASPFGSFASSREATISLLVEPAIALSLVALAIAAKTTHLWTIFHPLVKDPLTLPLWLLAGTGLYLSSLVELSRMPIDDPTTHLELTMVHEAMIIENSGPNLALTEFTQGLKIVVLFGLACQCLINGASTVIAINDGARAFASLAGILLFSTITACIEASAVKLQWRKVPEFIAYGLTISLLALMVALSGGKGI